MIRNIKILLALAAALWGLLGGLGNLAGYSDGMQSVYSVLSMETLPEGTLPDGPREPSPILVTLGFAFIWVFKLLGGALCGVGFVRMLGTRKADAKAFAQAKRWAVAGCGVMLFMLFVGFSLVALGPFKLYLSPLVGAVELAAVLAAQIGLIMVFLHQADE